VGDLGELDPQQRIAPSSRAALDAFLLDPNLSIPAAARELDLTPQALYQRARRAK
jgi:transposase-like protein